MPFNSPMKVSAFRQQAKYFISAKPPHEGECFYALPSVLCFSVLHGAG